MMKLFALLGAELPELDIYGNWQRTNDLRAELVKQGLSFVGVSNITAKKKNQLFLIDIQDEEEAFLLARKFGQKAFLISDESRNMEVVSTRSNRRTTLGKFVPVSKSDALKAKFHITFSEDGQQYFYVTKKGVSCDKTVGTRVHSSY